MWKVAIAQTPGTVDPGFSGDGIVTSAIGTGNDQVFDIAATADNKIVAVGQTWNGSNYDIVVIRYNTDGTLDNTFSSDGITVIPVGTGNDYSEGVGIQTDGKIIVSGYTEQGAELDALLIRLTTNGALDATFDGDGKKIIDYGPGDDLARDVQIQADGKIVICGSTWNGTDYDALVARFNTNGTPDLTFNGTGNVKIGVGGNDFLFQLEIQPDGKIVGGGYNTVAAPNVMLIRLNSSGTLDNSFDGDGISLSQWGTYAINAGTPYTLALQKDGKIILAGGMDTGLYSSRMVVARYTSDGSFDQTFGSNGILDIFIATTSNSVAEAISDIAIQSDGKIVASGSSFYGNQAPTFIVLRVTTSGTLDNTFGGGDGYTSTNIGNSNNDDLQTSLEIQPDGKIVVGGSTFNGSNYDVALVRYFSGLETTGTPCTDAPTGLYADDVTASKAKIHWNAITSASKYKIQYRPSGTSAWTNLNSTVNTKILTGLTPSTTYDYRVKNVCGTTPGNWSSIATFTTLAQKLEESSVNDGIINQEITVYPNPVLSVANITVSAPVENGTLLIYDINGKQLFIQPFSEASKMNVSNLSKGLYIVEVRGVGFSAREKLIVE